MSIYVKGGRSTIRTALKVSFSLFFPPRPITYQREEEQEDECGPAAALGRSAIAD